MTVPQFSGTEDNNTLVLNTHHRTGMHKKSRSLTETAEIVRDLCIAV